jgi:hypothetical protein
LATSCISTAALPPTISASCSDVMAWSAVME